MTEKVSLQMLNERSRQVLFAVVQSYINSPEPVGSRSVTKKYSFGCSPATIRNIMADLEELGFLKQPHISAGRVPTDKGYRFYVDSLRNIEEAKNQDEVFEEIKRRFIRKLENIRNNINIMFMEATATLSEMSNYIGVVMPPKPENTTFNRIDFIRYRPGTVAAILLTDEGVIKNNILSVDAMLSQEDLNRIADYLNSEYSGRTIEEIRNMLLKSISREKAVWDKLIERAIKLYEQAISFTEENIFVSGLYDVMNLPDFSNISRIREISRAIKDKHMILKLLEQISDAEGVQVLIGSENPVDELKNLSVVASTCKEKDRPMGVIAVIGPTRMDYSKAIYMVDTIAKCISRTFD